MSSDEIAESFARFIAIANGAEGKRIGNVDVSEEKYERDLGRARRVGEIS